MLSSLSRASALCMLLSLINGVQSTPLDLGVITEADLETRQTTNPSACALGVHMVGTQQMLPSSSSQGLVADQIQLDCRPW